ncbi:MAG: N-acetyltransferase [Alphaproteobacteria bacterium]|nr:N-acetyltransferase [Alphaproteobacteria bacterium]
MILIRPQRPSDAPVVEDLLERAFGPDRLKKTAYRLRDNVAPERNLSFVAAENNELRGSLRFWRVWIRPSNGSAPIAALLLGPLAVEPALRGKGIGLELMRHGLDRARALGHRIVILVGDEPYYAKVGFSRQVAEGLSLPGPVDPARLLGLELEPGALEGVSGMLEKWSEGPYRQSADSQAKEQGSSG